MYTFIIVLMIIVALLLCIVVLIQSGKGGGLASSFSSSNQILGVRQTTDTIEKITWGFGTGLFVLAIVGSFSMPTATTATQTVRDSKLKGKLENVTTTVPSNQPLPGAQQGQQAPPAEQKKP